MNTRSWHLRSNAGSVAVSDGDSSSSRKQRTRSTRNRRGTLQHAQEELRGSSLYKASDFTH